MPIGLLKWCLDYAKNPKTPPGGIFFAVKAIFDAARKICWILLIRSIHSEMSTSLIRRKSLTMKIAKQAMSEWINGLILISGT